MDETQDVTWCLESLTVCSEKEGKIMNLHCMFWEGSCGEKQQQDLWQL